MLLAEDLLLLLTDDHTGKATTDGTKLSLALAGAVVLELATEGRVDVSGPGEEVRAGRLVVRDATPTGDPVLDQSLGHLAARRPGRPQDVLGGLGRGLRATLLDRLVGRGILRAEEGRVLGIFPTRSWPAADSAHEESLRRALHDVLVLGRTPAPREGALISLLHAVDQVPKLVGGPGSDRRQLRRRAKEIAEGEFAGTAVRKAVEAVNAATMAAITATTVATAGSS
ncbi:GPP34 family phosphoprotein [Georgenia yuyongxinii]|uniref:GPP34 family phosphoprotein n=1 Tax=Georgenia yuyongxinii TaxID=2589797 RepID=A0A5B8C8F9_9MICO|nr:GPP34 family phosphoprotein [Georgenia yuyongxinii]QDC24246.1 GPP34 family phosphoprotein [Georgenia yuyongxinii]